MKKLTWPHPTAHFVLENNTALQRLVTGTDKLRIAKFFGVLGGRVAFLPPKSDIPAASTAYHRMQETLELIDRERRFDAIDSLDVVKTTHQRDRVACVGLGLYALGPNILADLQTAAAHHRQYNGWSLHDTHPVSIFECQPNDRQIGFGITHVDKYGGTYRPSIECTSAILSI